MPCHVVQVTAPVRETAAQALSLVAKPLEGNSVCSIMALLQQLQHHNDWDVRYGGYLGLKYILAIRLDLASLLLPGALPALMAGLKVRRAS